MNFSFLCDDNLYPGRHINGCFGSGGVSTNLEVLIKAFLNTAILSFSALVVSILIGIVIGTFNTLQNRPFLRFFATFWVEFFRNIPLLIQLLIFYFVVPKAFPLMLKILPPYALAIIGLGFFTSARIAEQVKAAIEAIPSSQNYAAMALGFTTIQTYRYVLLPRAIRTILPPLTSEAMGLVKNSSVTFAIGIPELLRNARQTTETTSLPIENYFLATILYMCIAFLIFLILSFIESKLQIPELHNEKRRK